MSGASIVVSGGLLGPGGVETHLALLLPWLAERGHRVTLAAREVNWRAFPIAEMRDRGVDVALPPDWLRVPSRMEVARVGVGWLPLLGRRATSVYWPGAGLGHAKLSRLFSGNPVTIYHEIVGIREAGPVARRTLGAAQAAVGNSDLISADIREMAPGVPVRTIPFVTSAAAIPRATP